MHTLEVCACAGSGSGWLEMTAKDFWRGAETKHEMKALNIRHLLDDICSYFQIAPVPQKASLTQLLVESCAYASQQGQGNQVSKAGSNGGGHVVWVNANLSRSDNHPDHDKPCFGAEKERLAVMVLRC
ncbi:hypothetical protein AOLI_G00248410 [Acnodon oligacanthus]